MTPEEARAHFDRALDGELDAKERRAFEAALAADPVLQAEYDDLHDVVERTRALAHDDGPKVDLLGGVQSRLRERSGGRFYRDRFAEGRGRNLSMGWMIAAAAFVLIAATAWLVLGVGSFAPSP